MSSLAFTHNLAMWVLNLHNVCPRSRSTFWIQFCKNLAAAKRQTTLLQGSKLRLTGRQCDQNSSVGDKSLRPNGRQWATHVFFRNLLTSTENGKIKGTICSNRPNNRNREFFDHQLGCHIWFSTFILERKLNNRSTVNPSFFFAVKTVNIWLSHRKTSKWLACSKSPYNALQTLEYWVHHVCLRNVSPLFDFTIWRLKSNIWRLFFTLSRQMATWGFFF